MIRNKVKYDKPKVSGNAGTDRYITGPNLE